MKLLSVRSARSIWLVPLTNLNPRGHFLLPAAAAIVERYRFAKAPDMNSLITSPTKIVFEVGAFPGIEGFPVYVNLTLHDDGLVVETRSSTNDGDRFLEDLLSWIAKEYQLPMQAELGIKKIYVSELTIRFESSISFFGEKFQTFSDSLKSGLGPNQPRPMNFVQLSFGTDPAIGQQSLLRIEREINTPFSENRYFSYAPIQTHEHLELLRQFERAAS